MQHAAATQPRDARARRARYLAPALLALLLAGVAIVVVKAPGSSGTHPRSGRSASDHGRRRVRPFWTVRAGDTLAQIALKTGLTLNQLEAYNPNAAPNSLQPGERLNLWRHPPRPRKRRPKPLGPLFWVVRTGQSLASIAVATRVDLATLEALNRRLSSAILQPGDRVRLRHGAPLLWGSVAAALTRARDKLLGGKPPARGRRGTRRRSMEIF